MVKDTVKNAVKKRITGYLAAVKRWRIPGYGAAVFFLKAVLGAEKLRQDCLPEYE